MNNNEKESQKEPMVDNGFNKEEISLLEYIPIILKYRRMVLLICGIAMVTTAIISLSSPKIYPATASIIPPEERSVSSGLPTGLSGGLGSFARGALGIESVTDRYIGILASRVVADAIVDRFKLIEIYDVKKRFAARKTLRANTTINASKENIVKITVKDNDPNMAAAIANAYVEELDRQNRRLSGGQATAKRISIGNRLKEIEEDLSNIENIPSREAKIKEKVYETLVIEYELAKIEEAESMPTIQILDRAIIPETRMSRGAARKTALAGVASFILAIFVVRARENMAKKKEATVQQQLGFMFESREDSEKVSEFDELESTRKIVGMQRRKPAKENKSYAQGVTTPGNK